MKNKAAFELKIAEDDEIFSALNTAAVTNVAQNVNVATDVTRAAMAQGFEKIEKKRLVVGNILMHPRGFRGIRGTWTQADLDQVNMQAQ